MRCSASRRLWPGCRSSAPSWPRAREPPRRRRRPHLFWLLRRYHPGFVLVLGIVMGVGFVIPTTFLPTYVKQLDIPRTGPFFMVYSVTAFIARLSTRRMPHVFGVRPMIYIGLAAMVASLLAYLPVTSEWGLMVPGVFAGIAHAVLFPAVTAQGSCGFSEPLSRAGHDGDAGHARRGHAGGRAAGGRDRGSQQVDRACPRIQPRLWCWRAASR